MGRKQFCVQRWTKRSSCCSEISSFFLFSVLVILFVGAAHRLAKAKKKRRSPSTADNNNRAQFNSKIDNREYLQEHPVTPTICSTIHLINKLLFKCLTFHTRAFFFQHGASLRSDFLQHLTHTHTQKHTWLSLLSVIHTLFVAGSTHTVHSHSRKFPKS